MSFTNRIQSVAAYSERRALPRRTVISRTWNAPANINIAASRVLDNALNSMTLQSASMRAGSRVTILRDDHFDAAVSLYKNGQWIQAFDALAKLADKNHASAARLALLMLRYGPTLFRSNFKVVPLQVASWARRVINSSHPLQGGS